MFLPWQQLAGRFDAALDDLKSANPARITDLRNSSLFFFIHRLHERLNLQGSHPTPPIILITETTQRAQQMQQFLCAVERLASDREPAPGEYLVFPDFEPQNLFEYAEPPIDLLDARNQVFDALRRGKLKVLTTSYKALWRRLPEPEDYYAGHLALHDTASTPPENDGDEILTHIERDVLADRLASLGYSITNTVVEVGQYAVRGGIVDVYPVGAETPVRVDLFGDEIDALSQFDPTTQRTTDPAGLTRILPLRPHLGHLKHPAIIGWLTEQWEAYTKEHKDLLPKSTFNRLREVVENDLELLSVGAECPRAGWYYRASSSEATCLLHYLPMGTQLLINEDGFVDSESSSYFRFWRNRFGDWLKNGLSFLDFDAFYFEPSLSLRELATGLTDGTASIQPQDGLSELSFPTLNVLFAHAFESPADDGLARASVGLDNPPSGKWGTARIAQSIGKYPTLTPEPGQPRVDRPISVLSQFSTRLREVLSDEGLHPEIENSILPGGFVVPATTAQPEWTVITDVEVFGEITEVTPTQPRRFKGQAVKRADELNPGDYVVHIDYGIGRFAQLTDRPIGGVKKTYVEVEYAGEDKLFVPVEQLDRLRRYSFDGSEPQLNHLGRDTWMKTKEKVRRDTLELAKRLLSLYKTRLVRAGHSYTKRTVWEQEFAEGFPYQLTQDQVRAWKEIETDMEGEKPMDRLLVGDVGFGKTELSMRAAFKACVDEYQVLVLCPTTVLADQHYRNFSRRFRAFPFRVAQLSRFQSKAEQKDVLEKLRTGRVDVVIATHRALSKDVVFKRVGLLVIDEEQRFGVKQKEKWKMNYPEIDVLAMSATPIPRSLHMSLVGVRDISLIETAPVARKPVKTYVGEHDDVLIKEAILRELGRGGQIYYLHNRVQDIDKVQAKLESLIPNVKVIVGHGQMREDRLEEVMHAFSLGAYKILLATTIIENGLDIPSVNTIILDNAENLGLAQMHQLRGRVGRSNQQAYAYFFHQPNRILTEEAQNRLHAIYNYAYLGAGYEIAQSDLRIRGAGNLLGEAQSGLAKQVGFEYYCELLARSISDVKALDKADIEEWEDTPLLMERPAAQLDVPLASFIPEEYISDPVLRLEILRDLSAMEAEEELTEFAAGLKDRFGELPQEVENLLLVVRLRNLAGKLGIERLSYNRVQQHFTLKLFDDEGSWFKRAPLLDSRFQPTGAQQLKFELEFSGVESGSELFEALSGLGQLKVAK